MLMNFFTEGREEYLLDDFFIAFCFGSFYRFQSVDCREPVEFWRASYCICPIDYYGKSTGFTYGVPIVFQERRQR